MPKIGTVEIAKFKNEGGAGGKGYVAGKARRCRLQLPRKTA